MNNSANFTAPPFLFETVHLEDHDTIQRSPSEDATTTVSLRRRDENEGRINHRIYRIDPWQRRETAQRIARNSLYSLFQRVENSNIFQNLYKTVKQWRTRRRQAGVSEAPVHPYSYVNSPWMNYNPNATYSKQEQLIRSLVDRWIAFKNQFQQSRARRNQNSNLTGSNERQVARDFAERIDRYLFSERRRHQQIAPYRGASDLHYSDTMSFRMKLWWIFQEFTHFIYKIIRWILQLLFIW